MGKIFKPLTILVTGHKGFIGSNMCKFLLNINHKVKTVDVDYKDYTSVLHATEGVDWVMHFAANMGGIGFFASQNYYPVIDNFLMDLNILRACEANKVKRLFYPSSACIYNTDLMSIGMQLSEDLLSAPAKPDQMYGWEKLTMLKLMKESLVDCRVGILHTIYGEGQSFIGPKAKFPPQMAYKCLKAVSTGELNVWGDGNQTRTFLHIDDAINKIYAVMNHRTYHGEVNIGSDEEVSVNGVVDIICGILNIKPKIRHNLRQPVGPTRRTCSNKKFDYIYKVKSKVSLKEGFTRLINYVKLNESSEQSKYHLRSGRHGSRSRK